MLPAETTETTETSKTTETTQQAQPPWEQAPDDFAAAPPPDRLAPWPTSSTGPMYVWNPAATTAPLRAIPDDEDSD